jgi:uncharacterized peroxidase-related enzyme
MAWIDMVNESEAEGRLKEFYQKMGDPKTGQVPNIIKILSLNPKHLENHAAFFKGLMFGRSGLSRPQREMIATVVSTVNECHY